MKYAPGDKVRLVTYAKSRGQIDDDEKQLFGKVLTVFGVDCSDEDDDNRETYYPYTVKDDDGNNGTFNRFQLEPTDSNNKETTTMSNTLDNPLQALKDLETDADTRLLRDAGFENENGELRSNAVEELNRREWAKIRTEVAADLRKAIANEKADKEVTTTEAKG